MKATKNVVPLSRDVYNKIICLFQKEEFINIQDYCKQNEVLSDYVYSELKYFFIDNEQHKHLVNADKKITLKFDLFALLQRVCWAYNRGIYLYMYKDNGELYLADKFNIMNGDFLESGIAIANLSNRIVYDIYNNILSNEMELDVYLEGDFLDENINKDFLRLDIEPLNKFINNYIRNLFSNKMVDFAIEPTAFFEKMFLDNYEPITARISQYPYPSLSLDVLKNEEVRFLFGSKVTIKNIKSSIENYKGNRKDSIVEYIKELYIFMLDDIKKSKNSTQDHLDMFGLSLELKPIVNKFVFTNDELSLLVDEFNSLFFKNDHSR